MRLCKQMRNTFAVVLFFFLPAYPSSARPSARVDSTFSIQGADFPENYPATFIKAFDLSPDGKILAVEFEAWEGKGLTAIWVALWNTEDNGLISHKRLEGPGKDILANVQYSYDIRFTRDGRKLLVLTGPRLLTVDVNTLDTLHSISSEAPHVWPPKGLVIRNFSISRDSRILAVLYDFHASYSPSSTIRVFDFQSGRLLTEWTIEGTARSMSLSPGGKQIILSMNTVIAGRKVPLEVQNVLLVDTRTGRRLRGFNTGYLAGDAQFLPDGKQIATISANVAEWRLYSEDTLKIWDAESAELLEELHYEKYGIRGTLAIAHEAPLLAVSTGWGNPTDIKLDRDVTRGFDRLQLWDISTGKLLFVSSDLAGDPLPGFGGFLTRVSASGTKVAVGGTIVHVYRISND
ncbi:MAG: WD40 repeat domain-containing protein [Candidatus Binatia bacterium]